MILFKGENGFGAVSGRYNDCGTFEVTTLCGGPKNNFDAKIEVINQIMPNYMEDIYNSVCNIEERAKREATAYDMFKQGYKTSLKILADRL